ncbi:MAG: AmmeMemoRadiSam system radical SAM enzyme [Candidatus Methanosuratincola sp.]|nr:AmmeMemoRadiSam system radical SAM enzyme [Candidatus Methanosuratincola sp.]
MRSESDISKKGGSDRVEALSPARWWEREAGAVRCLLCPRTCIIKDGKIGFCMVRRNIGGSLFSTNYGIVSVSTIDNIEKKPIFHFLPGSKLYSVGSFGCNLRCLYCQNYPLVEGGFEAAPHRRLPPRDLVSEAISRGADGIAWTFNEPIVWSEYVIETSRLAHKEGLYCMLNTNGYIMDGPRDELLEVVDAIKVDIKGFSNRFYNEVCGGSLGPVLRTCRAALGKGIHIEIAYPVVRGMNDSPDEIGRFCEWVRLNLGSETPVHFIMVHSFHRIAFNAEIKLEDLEKIRISAIQSGLNYVYIGGTTKSPAQNTYCPGCGDLLISRAGDASAEKVYYKDQQVSRFCPSRSDVRVMLSGRSCPRCGRATAIVTK